MLITTMVLGTINKITSKFHNHKQGPVVPANREIKAKWLGGKGLVLRPFLAGHPQRQSHRQGHTPEKSLSSTWQTGLSTEVSQLE